ncbi:SDR family oxidoreductase [Pelagibacterium xiamenense]|uniref:SDR family oxidoreductase n=1 Tax=Pelagibacterium xiamenense TaxID=2901140 RepID=UPI001E3CF2B5|nr:SDR family oxidoreductase [Pelagibacterium xiamenense]MCD7058954.1 SDR family oxidoreductase [Pelagibacterium xiamenense]
MRLAGKSIFVSAAAQGIGRASAIAFAKEGARVFATDINAGGLRELSEEHTKIESHPLDVLDTAAVNALAAELPDLDGIFNCAGFVHNGTIEAVTEPEWDFSFDLNIKAMYRTVKAFLPGLLRRAEAVGTASILNMSSMASSTKGFPNRLVYGTTKAAVIGFTKAMAADYVTKGLRCNALCPGTVDTPSLRDRIAAFPDPVAAEQAFIARQPMGRLATVDDITPMAVYLLSDESQFVSGQALLVDGGVTI